MKTVIEKIILTYFGTFINGIHKDKLSIDLFGGNFQLENISLNQQYFDGLNTPFKLTYSSIGKLNLQAPLSRLSSAPVECILDNIYAVFEFKQDAGEKEELTAEQLFRTRKEELERHIREMFDSYLKKLREKQDKKEDGMMAKLGKKIIDNLQLKIVNVHVRFEEKSSKQNKYGWGVTLEQISFYTTNKEWAPAFVDRSAEINRNEKLFKKMNLKNLSVYWQSAAKSSSQDIFITMLESQARKKEMMRAMIYEKQHSIISLTSEFKLVINPIQKLDVPLYELSVELAPIKFELERVQVSEMIEFAQKNMVKSEIILKKLSMKKKKSTKSASAEEKKKFEGTFIQYVENCIDKIQENQQQSGKKPANQQMDDDFEMIAILKTIFSRVEQEQLLLWALKPIRSQVRLARERELKKKKKGWFGGEYQLTEEEIRAMQNFVEEIKEIEDDKRPVDCLFFSLAVIINGGVFSFVEHKDTESQERIQFKIGKIESILEKSQNDSLLSVELGIKQIFLDLFLPQYQAKQKLQLNILMNEQPKLTQQLSQSENFISLKYVKKVLLENEGKPTIKTDIEGSMKRIIFTYKKLYLKKFKSFFTFKNVKEQMKNETLKKWEQIKEKNQQKTQEQQQEEDMVNGQDESEVVKMFNIKVQIISPLFICPLSEADCWCLSLGHLTIFSERDEQKEVYPMKIKSAYFRYYADLKDCLKNQIDLKRNPGKIYQLVNDINFQLIYSKYLFERTTHAEVALPTFSVNFTEQQYQNLLSLKDIFKMDDEQSNFVETLKKQRLQVQQNMRYSGQLQKKNELEDIDKWRQFYGILSGEFIYLYGSQKELKCIEKISLKHSRIEYDGQNKIITLVNQEGIVYITGTEHDDNASKWQSNIEKQLKQFLSVFDIVEDELSGGFQEQQDSPRKRKETERSLHDSSMIVHSWKKSLEVRINKISFNYQKQTTLESIMAFQVDNLVVFQSQYQKVTNRKITIEQLLITDFIYKYPQQASSTNDLQSLMKTNNIQMTLTKDKNLKNRKNEVWMKIPQIYINWKPDVLIILLQLISKHFSKEKKLRVDDGQAKTRDELIAEVFSDRKFDFSTKEYQRNSKNRKVKQKRLQYAQKNKLLKQLMVFKCEIDEMKILMIHRQSHQIMFQLVTRDIKNQFVLGENEKFVSGCVGMLELWEMTGYPRSDYTNSSGEKPEPYRIISTKDGGKGMNPSEPLIDYKWSSYQPFVLPNAERINGFLYITLNPITCEYYQQITFRAIDYILIQIILLLNQPEMLIANENLLEQLRKTASDSSLNQKNDQQQNIVKVLFSEYEEIIKRIVDPYFMDMYIKCFRPSVIIKPEKTSELFYRADFQSIVFENVSKQDGKRFESSVKGTALEEIINYVYEEQYIVFGYDCKFYSVAESTGDRAGEEQLLFQPITLEMVLNKLIMEDQLNVLYPELNNYDRSFYTKNNIPELVANKLTKHQYLLLNKLTNFNMIFDDCKDELFIHNFKITKLLSPKPIYYELNLGRIYLMGKEGREKDRILDLFEVSMERVKMIYQRSPDLNSSFKILIGETQVNGFEYPTDPKSKPDDNISRQNLRKLNLMQIKAPHQHDNGIDLTIKMRTTGEKIIEMNIDDIEASLHLHLLQLIFEWSLLEDWVFPIISIYANDITFHLTIHKMSAWLQQQTKAKTSNKKMIEQRPKARKMAQSEPIRAFRLLGVFCYKFHRKAFFSQQHIEKQFRNSEITTNEINNLPEISYQTILLNTEVENCLRAPETNTVFMKRQVIEKMTLNMIEKKYYKVANEANFTIKSMVNRKLNLDRGLFKISFTDVILMNEIMETIGSDRKYIEFVKKFVEQQKQLQPARNIVNVQSQMSLEEERLPFENILKSKSEDIGDMPKFDEDVPRLNKNFETQLSSLDNLDIDIESVSLYLINNCRESFIPVFKIQINSAAFSKANTFKKNLLKGNFEIIANYFNTSNFKWEPMLEKVDVIFHELVYRGPPPNEVQEYYSKVEGIQIESSDSSKKFSQNKFSSLQTNQPVLLNISKEMVLSWKEMQSQWQKNQQRKLSTSHSQLAVDRSTIGLEYDFYNNNSTIFLQQQQRQNEDESIEVFVSQYVIRNETGYPIEIYSHQDKKLRQTIPHMKQINYSNELQSYDDEGGNQGDILIGFCIVHHPKHKFKRVTHISLDMNVGFEMVPLIVGLNLENTLKYLPKNSVIRLVPEIKDSKRHLTLKSTKSIESYLDNMLQKTVLPFDHEERVKLYQQPHNGIEVSLYKEMDKEKYRYVGRDGKLKILPKNLVYNFTPIPLNVCSLMLMPGEFVGIAQSLTIQNIKWRDCKGVKVEYNEKAKEYYIYCEGYVIDYAGLYFEFNSGYDAKAFSHEFIEKGYRYNIYLLADGDSKFKVRIKKNYKSNGSMKCSETIKPAVGNQVFHLHNPQGALCEYQTYGYLSSFSGKEHSQYRNFKKVVEIAPLHILSNTTNYKVKVCQIESCQSITLQPGERIPFFWENRQKPKAIKIAILTQDQMWGYSGPLQIELSTNSFVVRKTTNFGDYKIMRTQIQSTNTINFVHILESKIQNGTTIVLSNKVEGISFKFYQASIFEKDHEMMDPSQYVFTVKPKQEVPFGFQLPLENHKLTMEAVFDSTFSKFKGCTIKAISLEDIETNLYERYVSVYRGDKRVKKLLVRCSFEKNVKKLQILEKKEEKLILNKGQFICKIPRIGVSFIGYQESVRKEIVAIFLEGIEFEAASTDEITQYSLVLRGLKIDNCLKIAPMFPILLQSLITHAAEYFLNFKLTKDNYNSQLIHYFGVSINKFVLTVSSQQIQCIQQNFNEITEVWNSESNKDSLSLRKFELFTNQSIQPENIYFVQAEIQPLKANVTFKHVNNWGGRLLKAFAGIDDCNVSVDGKRISHFSSRNIGEFGKHLMLHYKEGISKMLIPMIGNLSILGSPISLVQRIGSGIKDLVELPSQGFTISPLEGGKGFAKGAGSLVKNTFEGAFNSVESMTGSVGNGLSTLVFDDDFNRQRQKIKNEKSEHIGQGLSNGAKSIVNGVGRGLTGLVTSPLEGAQESGIGGFFLGGLKGLTGLVIKPVSGIFDATTKTFEGIKNTPSFISKSQSERASEFKRARNPRIFYGITREFKSYDQDLSMCAKLLVDIDKEQFENLSWFGLFHLESVNADKKPLIFLTYEFMVIYNYAKGNILQIYRSEDLQRAKATQNNFVALQIYDRKKKRLGRLDLKLRYPIAKKLASDINAIRNLYKPVYGFDYEVFTR